MPSKVQKTGNKRGGFDTTFVNYKLSGKEKEAFAEFFDLKPDVHATEIVKLMGQGVKFSFSENREQGTCLASATMRDEGNINYNRCITSRSPDWYEALLMCVFKANTLGVGDDWLDQAGDDNWG